MLKIATVVIVSLSLAGCGLAARKQRQEQMAAARAAMEQGFADCNAQYPEGSKQYVAKNKCDAQAALAIRPFTSWPDLFDREWATRAVIAGSLCHWPAESDRCSLIA
jgi:hypothetical protein